MRVRRVAILILVGVSLIAQEPLGPTQNGDFYSLEKEAALGKQLAAEFRRRTIPIDSPVIQNYLDRLGQKIGANLPDAKFRFTFSVIADDPCGTIHEPAALPGGYVFVPAGLFVSAQEEDEFAGMLAHAMEHVAQRHGTRQATRGTTSTIPLTFIGGGCLGGPAVPVAFLASQRSADLEADVLAVRTMARAGFDPNALVRYVERVQVQPTGTISKANSPIPGRDERMAALLATIEKLPKVDHAAGPPDEFATARQEVRRLMRQSMRSEAPPSLMRKKQE